MNLTACGGGKLSFMTTRRYFSSDYGRTWPTSVEHPKTGKGIDFHIEGNAWVDRDTEENAEAILELGWHYEPGKRHPIDDATVVFRRSIDGGFTWEDETSSPQWKFINTYKGKEQLRGVSEGPLVRAQNGWLVAALRTDVPDRILSGSTIDHWEGTAVSVSKDDGKTWSDMQFLFDAGRNHANLQRLPSGDLVCVMIVRADVQGGKQVSLRRGSDALVSHDNGLT